MVAATADEIALTYYFGREPIWDSYNPASTFTKQARELFSENSDNVPYGKISALSLRAFGKDFPQPFNELVQRSNFQDIINIYRV